MDRETTAGAMTNQQRRSDVDADWEDVARQWTLRSGTIYLNHGSFGPPPEAVVAARLRWQRELDQQPMDFFTRRLEPAWHATRAALARFLHVEADTLVFVDNATVGMNEVAASFPLEADDEVLLNDHEYGAVRRIWERRSAEVGARVREVELAGPFVSPNNVVDRLMRAITPCTRLIVVSHITSPTAVILPVQEICRRARAVGVSVCIDGPHAVAQLPLNIGQLECDFYVASCHKWLSAPFGSGFLYVAPAWQPHMRPTRLSWGVLLPQRPRHWWEEYYWSGTRDPSAYLAIRDALDFLEAIGFADFRSRTHFLARYARTRLVELTGREPLVPDDETWYASMAHVPLPPGNAQELQQLLWQRFGIEVPIVEFQHERYVRVSCHLYNHCGHIDALVAALAALLRQGH